MEVDNKLYVHMPVNGLPNSLLAEEGKTFAVIALMQRKAGLNRERRRELQNGVKINRDLGSRIGVRLPKSEMNLLSYFLSPEQRFGSFWVVVECLLDSHGGRGSRAYSLAVDAQLLEAYQPECLKLRLDEDVLTSACPEWPRIRDGILQMPRVEKARLGVFMIWPRVVEDLRRWADMDESARTRIAHAVFSLSSIGWTHWFIEEALRCCPDLEAELGLLTDRIAGNTASNGFGTCEAVEEPAPQNALRKSTGLVDAEGEDASIWAELMQRLDLLAAELKSVPTKEAVSDLAHLTGEIESLSARLPNREAPVSATFEACRRELIAHLRRLAEREGFDWLESDLISQIDARWQLALRERLDADRIEALATDAEAAITRTDEAAATFSEAAQAVLTNRNAVAEAEEQLARAKGFAEHAVAKRRRTEELKRQVDADLVQQAAQEKLIDVASPFGEPYDYTRDYASELEVDSTGSESEDLTLAPVLREEQEVIAEPEPTLLTAGAVTAGEILTSAIPPEPKLALQSEDHKTAEEAASVFSAAASIPVDLVQPGPGANAKDESSATPTEYSDAAGEACRPVWRMLQCGQAGLAYHAATWLVNTNPAIKVPSRDLLAAVALSEHLMLPDGGIQSAIGARFEGFVPADFASESPRAWHSAVNLLLSAATLRPMILAPATGAASVAAYLHQDGHYPALYALVQHLRELSPLLIGFRIEPSVLREARGEAAIRSDLKDLQQVADDWLRVQAPAYTIKFAAATHVWRQWLRPGGEIDALVAPVAHNRVAEADRVRELLATMSNTDHVLRLIHDTDRKVLQRRRGEDIHAGALDHLLRNVEEALRLPRQWLALVELLGRHGDRMRSLLEQVVGRLRESKTAVEGELSRPPEHDPWGLVEAGQTQALRAIRSLTALFDADTELPPAELSAAEALGRPLLLVQHLTVDDEWAADSPPETALAAIAQEPNLMEPDAAILHRLDQGDVFGAELLMQTGQVNPGIANIRQELDRWKQALRREILECRRSVEVGSAYGYLADAERGQMESRLALWEAQVEDVRRFDVALDEVRAIRERVARAREGRAEEVRQTLRGIAITDEMQQTAADVEQALGEGDMATANELVHWLAQGRPAPTDLDDETREGFERFFPAAVQPIEGWLEGQRREVVEQALRQGQAVPGLGAQPIAEAQRDRAAKMFGVWSDMKGHQGAEAGRLEVLFTGLGLTVKELHRIERVAGREVWTLDSLPIEDRHICPSPMFGSTAAGKYRVVCAWGRPAEDELLQWVGDSSSNRPTILLYFGRMTERMWRDLSRLAKTKRRSFVLLDETLLVYLCYSTGARLKTWLDAALPFSYSLPYDATAGLVPPEMFYGRGTELDAVRGLNGRCFIYGGRQLGKTALLKRAEQSFHSPSSGHYARWVDLRAEGIGVSRAAGEVWLTLHEKLKEMQVLDPKSAAPVPGKKQSIESVIRAIRDFVGADTDRRVLLLLDEADRFFEQDGRNDFEETRRLKQLMDETGRRFKVVFAGLHNVLRMTERPNHPLAHFGEPIEIGPLREGEEVREAADLIRRPMAAAGFHFESRGLVIRILAQTNYYPSLIQLYCSHLLRHLLAQVANRQKQNGPRYVVTDRDIEQVYSSDALRDEIRAKFRLTLQLDPRYEVVAYAMAWDLLRGRYSQDEGIPWQTIRQSGALHWWPEGFRDTSESDFRVLLDEMVGLGVLRRLPAGRYVLRNPNVLLLLGTQEEIEAVLIKDREPAVEFESASFRPPLRRAPSSPQRNVFTYQQLSRLLQRTNNITIVTGAAAAGVDGVVASLEDYLGTDAAPVVMNGCADRQSFGNALQNALLEREKDLVTVFVVPETLPWTDLWLVEAQTRLRQLRSGNKFASIVFVAEPATLWRLLGEDTAAVNGQPPWMSLLHWKDEFLRHWLEERQLQLESEERRRLGAVTGLWPALIMELAANCNELRALRERIGSAADKCFSEPNQRSTWRERFGLNVGEPSAILEVLARLGEPVESTELALVAEAPHERVQRSLRWGELLGLVRSEGAGFWTIDPIASKALLAASD